MDERVWDDLLNGGALKLREVWERDPLSEGRIPLPRRSSRLLTVQEAPLRGRREELGHLEMPLSGGMAGGHTVIYEHPWQVVRGHDELALPPHGPAPRGYYLEGDLVGYGQYPESWLVDRFRALGGGGLEMAAPGSPLAAIITVFYHGETPELFEVGFRLAAVRPGDPSSGYFDADVRPVLLVRNPRARAGDPTWDLVELADTIELERGELWWFFGVAMGQRFSNELPARYAEVRAKVAREIEDSRLRVMHKQTRYFGWRAALEYVAEQLGLRIRDLILEGLTLHPMRALAACIGVMAAQIAWASRADQPVAWQDALAAGCRGIVSALLWSRVREIRRHPFSRTRIRLPYGSSAADLARVIGHPEAAPMFEQYARSIMRILTAACGARLARVAAEWNPASGEAALAAALRTALAPFDFAALSAPLREAPPTVRYSR